MNEILYGDSYEILPTLPENSIDAMVTDPPYGASFMGKQWDRAVPSVEIWRECLRVMKPGAFAFVMSLPRQDCLARMIVNLEDAGFVVAFTPIFWAFATGFPKAANVSKLVDKQAGQERIKIGEYQFPDGKQRFSERTIGITDIQQLRGNKHTPITLPSTPQAQALDGAYAGFQPKPAVEIILVAMKPLSEPTYIAQALANGKGVTWLDDGRIPTGGNVGKAGASPKASEGCDRPWRHDEEACQRIYEAKQAANIKAQIQGRFPANLLVSDDVMNDGRISGGDNREFKVCYSGVSDGNCIYGNFGDRDKGVTYNDSGSFSRYFDLDAWFADRIALLPESAQRTFPYLIVPKPSRREKNAGLTELPLHNRDTQGRRHASQIDRKDGKGLVPVNATLQPSQNHHPTVKPIKLMSYLLTIGSRQGDVILDPFCGSGTTALACKLNHRQFVAIEREEEYCQIARARVAAIDEPQPDLLEAAA